MRRLSRGLWLALGLGSTALGLIGAVVPLMPTTIFLIIAAYCFSRSSERLEAWLLGHRHFGPTLIAWRRDGAIGRRAKIAACTGWASCCSGRRRIRMRCLPPASASRSPAVPPSLSAVRGPPTTDKEKPAKGGPVGCGSRIEACDLQLMSPTRPRHKEQSGGLFDWRCGLQRGARTSHSKKAPPKRGLLIVAGCGSRI